MNFKFLTYALPYSCFCVIFHNGPNIKMLHYTYTVEAIIAVFHKLGINFLVFVFFVLTLLHPTILPDFFPFTSVVVVLVWFA